MRIAAQRARRELELLARAGLDLASFVDEVMSALQPVVPSAGSCFATLDPATGLISGSFKYGPHAADRRYDAAWGLIEFGEPDETSFHRLLERGVDAVSMSVETDGQVHRSPRLGAVLIPAFGVGDELRAICRDRTSPWGALSLFRPQKDIAFSVAETCFMASVSGVIAHGVRQGILRQRAVTPPSASAPAVLIVDARGEVHLRSAHAEGLLALLEWRERPHSAPATFPPLFWTLVAAARVHAQQDPQSSTHTRVRTAQGGWLVLHAAPLHGPDSRPGDVAVTITHARAPEVMSLLLAASGLTDRECQVAELVLRGASTKEIAATLCLSPYTVQDHLKVVFGKVGVRSRRELISRIYVTG
ncbi:helix-turn-helix transcriptional regulator [Aestuariimicrobium sp. p3-SID1156]|uniref:helix-turn-helix transcriptional regulator n=1 Tax=Aestuariimicrobium sp. p3-SID1156 TaxID=2916038 RepID=UPI00223B85BE|nr:helix-turn-helix transcriptional regulator [Aestuariimicrobium sp. p3-SID1156]MCT1458216.1 helix-turn-helix transcriptional regulator [Aestuariimicrobium sp. p3-SID1156]